MKAAWLIVFAGLGLLALMHTIRCALEAKHFDDWFVVVFGLMVSLTKAHLDQVRSIHLYLDMVQPHNHLIPMIT